MANSLGRIGVWRRSQDLSPELAVGLERLGYGTLWVGSSPGGDLSQIEELLDATSSLVVATGIVNIWKDAAQPIAAGWHRIAARHPGRFALVAYLDELDDAKVPVSERVVAALGPRVLRLAAERSLGAHPYLTTPEHTRQARELLGEGVLLAPEQKVVLNPDPAAARAIGGPMIAMPYLALVNYKNNLRRLGYTDADFADGGSDRLIDALLAHGDAAAVATRVTEHLDAGADHVAIQLLTAPGEDLLDSYRRLADVLIG
jgi:alkanesulfonate monooxygenase SsuD/methylene tetrahydromethanopterin reductase-like flavin-dependent oxidoreductase (luciferase family)